MATFKTRARALDMLGRQQIAGLPTAISELFKNAHDADAAHAEIDYYRSDRLFVLRDDGLGMTEEEFLQRWLTLGTESKMRVKGIVPPPSAPDKKISNESLKLFEQEGSCLAFSTGRLDFTPVLARTTSSKNKRWIVDRKM